MAARKDDKIGMIYQVFGRSLIPAVKNGKTAEWKTACFKSCLYRSCKPVHMYIIVRIGADKECIAAVRQTAFKFVDKAVCRIKLFCI